MKRMWKNFTFSCERKEVQMLLEITNFVTYVLLAVFFYTVFENGPITEENSFSYLFFFSFTMMFSLVAAFAVFIGAIIETFVKTFFRAV
ncbi:MAG: hypothetical protein N4A38_02615 [Candidatus Gracilibacteria bacterium]|jgi:hypothetical protein|nr:hypothetical protein [Candidatus Gracilibacteria bacterium]